MATAKLTLIGLYNYDDSIFDNISLPAYFDKQTLINTILLTGGEFGVLYATMSLKNYIKIWSDKNQRWFERLAELMQIEYDPLENYYRREHWEDTGDQTDNTEGTSSGTSLLTGQTTGESESNGTTSGTTSDQSTTEAAESTANDQTDKVSAFNSNSFENRNLSEGTGSRESTTETSASGTTSGTSHETGTTSGTSRENGQTTGLFQREGVSNFNTTRDGYARGNIGVMSSQDMYKQELEVIDISPYDLIAGAFINEFCIKIY